MIAGCLTVSSSHPAAKRISIPQQVQEDLSLRRAHIRGRRLQDQRTMSWSQEESCEDVRCSCRNEITYIMSQAFGS